MESIQAVVLKQLKAIASEQFKSLEFKQIPVIVAYSGGLDSSVLLHNCHQLLQHGEISQLSAAHVNHGLQDLNAGWQQHCLDTCENYQIECHSKRYSLSKDGANSENHAREARYQYFEQLLIQPSILLFGHHLDDQVETMLFRILRGTGVHGLAGIPQNRRLANGWIVRPLLEFTRQQLVDYAEQHQLSWVDDPSNQQDDYARNFLRNNIIPQLKSRWPESPKAFMQLSGIAQQQTQMLDEIANQDVKAIQQYDEGLSLFQFNQLSVVRRKNLLHYWVRTKSGLAPTAVEINQVLLQLEESEANSIKIKLGGGWLRCFQKNIYYRVSNEPEKLSSVVKWDPIDKPLTLENGIQLKFVENIIPQQTTHLLLRQPFRNEPVTVRARVGGEIAKPIYRAHRAELKKIFQELKVPTWKRDWLPIVFYGDKIACIPTVFVDQAFADKDSGYRIEMHHDF